MCRPVARLLPAFIVPLSRRYVVVCKYALIVEHSDFYKGRHALCCRRSLYLSSVKNNAITTA